MKFLSKEMPLYTKLTDDYIYTSLGKKYPELLKSGSFSTEIIPILKKLSDDKYVVHEVVETIKYKINSKFDNLNCYGITFEGMSFIEKGGYRRKHFWESVSNLPKKYWFIGAMIASLGFNIKDILEYFVNKKTKTTQTIEQLESLKNQSKENDSLLTNTKSPTDSSKK